MLITDQQLLFFQRCKRRAYLDVYGDFSQKDSPSDFLQKLKQDSADYQKSVIADYTYQQPKYPRSDVMTGAKMTLELMKQGVEQIYRGVLLRNLATSDPSQDITLVSYPDLLVKHPGTSLFGDWLYVPISIRLGKRPKLDYQIVAAFHAYVLAAVQGVIPETSWLILRQKGNYAVNLEQRLPQMQEILSDYLTTLQSPYEPDVFIARQKCNLCQWYSYCHEIAQSRQHLSLLPGVTPSRYTRLQDINLTTVESLAQAAPQSLEIYPEFSEGIASQVIQQAHSTLKNQAFLRHKIPNSRPQFERPIRHSPSFVDQAPVELYFDIEAQPELNLDYLHGVLVVDRRSNTEHFHSFLAESEADEETIWKQFLELVWTYPIAPIFHFCDYEAKTIQRLGQVYQTPYYLWKPLLKRLVDVHAHVTQTVTLPVESYALKPIARWMGFEWRNSDANGAQCVCWYEQWLKTGDRTLLDTIVHYNEDDCRATFHVKQWLTNFLYH